MPKAATTARKSPSSETVTPKPRVAKKPDRELVYPEVVVNGVAIPDANRRITVTMAKGILGWEDEDAYTERVTKDNPRVKPEKAKFGSDFLLKDKNGKKVRCWRNANNRPFDENHAGKIAQKILQGHWRFNLETIVVSKFGNVTSGQHRLVGLVLASQIWGGAQHDHWVERWPEEPYIETLLACGGSEDPDVLMTVDDVKPRSLADVFYTSPLFSKLDPTGKRECARMLDKATDLVWRRVESKDAPSRQFTPYRTHQESVAFVDRHKTLLQCVHHIHSEDKGDRPVSQRTGIHSGVVAGAMYLMAQCDSSADSATAYLNDPIEKHLDLSRLDAAKAFWVEFSMKPEDSPGFSPLRLALASFVDEDSGTSGSRVVEKLCVLAKAWGIYLEAGLSASPFSPLNKDGTCPALDLEYTAPDDEGRKHLNEWPSFGGVDNGPKKVDHSDLNLTKKEIKERARKEQAAKLKEAVERKRSKNGSPDDPPSGTTLRGQLDSLREAHPGKLLLHRPKGGLSYVAYGDDATTVAKVAGLKLEKHPDEINRVRFNLSDFSAVRDKLLSAGRDVAIATEGPQGTFEVVPVVPPQPKVPNLPTKTLPRPLNRRADPPKPVVGADEEE